MRIFPASMLAVAFWASGATAQDVPSPNALAGVRLGQYLRAVEATFPKVKLERTTEDAWLAKGFALPDVEGMVVIVQCPPGDLRKVYSVQVTGNPTTGHPLFAGLRMGMTEAEVIRILGQPSGRRPYQEGGDSYVRLDFKGRNYSVEVDAQDRLMSVMLWGYEGLPEKPGGLAKVADLKAALASEDPHQLAEAFTPDAELFRGGDVLKIDRISEVVFGKDPGWRKALLGKGGLREALDRKDAEEDFQLRFVTGEGGVKQLFSVCKFPKSALLQEIVFAFESGRWRVYEVTFRGGAGK